MGEPILVETPHSTREPLVLHGLADLASRVGQELGASDWRTVEQEDIDLFAKLTGDEQWIHVDPERAKDGPFGATVQHGFLTLAWRRAAVGGLHDRGFGVVLNYGLNKVRFPAPLRVGQPDPHARRSWPRSSDWTGRGTARRRCTG